MDNINWGVPLTKARKEEKFDTAVVSMSALLKDGVSRKFSFNKAAISLLGLIPGESYVAIGFNGKDLFIKNNGVVNNDVAGEIIPNNSFRINGSYSFADKKTFEFIIKLRELNDKVENYLHLEVIEDKPFVKVSSITSVIFSEVIWSDEKPVAFCEEVKSTNNKKESLPIVEPTVKPEVIKFAIDETEVEEIAIQNEIIDEPIIDNIEDVNTDEEVW